MYTGGTNTIIGLDIGGTKIACVEGTLTAQILQRVEIPTRAKQAFDERFPAVAELVRGRAAEAQRGGRRVVALSVAIGGPLRIREGVLLDPPHLPGWHHIPLKVRLAREFPELPVHVEHDGNAGALAEFRFGAGRTRRGLRHLVFLTFGTGLGAGIVLNGQLLRGASDTAGEVGHWRLAPDGPLGFGKRGSWEGFASGAGLVQMAHRMFPVAGARRRPFAKWWRRCWRTTRMRSASRRKPDDTWVRAWRCSSMRSIRR